MHLLEGAGEVCDALQARSSVQHMSGLEGLGCEGFPFIQSGLCSQAMAGSGTCVTKHVWRPMQAGIM